MSKEYLPIKESLGYKNVKTAIWNVFGVNLDNITINEKSFENFNFLFYYNEYEIKMGISDTEKNIQFQFGVGGSFDIWFDNPNDTLWRSSFIYEVIEDKNVKEKIKRVFGKNEKDIEYAMEVLKEFLDSDNAKILLKRE